MRRAGLLAPVIAVALLLTGCTESGTQPDSGFVSIDDGGVDQWLKPTTAPVTFSGETVDGGRFDSKKYLGRVVVVNFWYAACPPCRSEAPDLKALAQTFAADGVQFVGVNTIDDAGQARPFEQEFQPGYPSIVDQADGASVQLAFAGSRGPRATPSTLVLDREGRVTARIVSRINKSVLRQLIQDAVDGTAA